MVSCSLSSTSNADRMLMQHTQAQHTVHAVRMSTVSVHMSSLTATVHPPVAIAYAGDRDVEAAVQPCAVCQRWQAGWVAHCRTAAAAITAITHVVQTPCTS